MTTSARTPARPRQPTSWSTALVVVVGLAATAGCGGGGSDEAGGSPSATSTTSAGTSQTPVGPSDPGTASESGTASSSPVGSASATPSTSPTGSTGSSGSSGTPTTRPPGLAGRLLAAEELPGRWAAGTTRPESPSSSFGTCQRFAITSIGAERVLVRRFDAPAAPRERAGALVAQFPDALTARRAFAVLKAWHDRCGDRLGAYPQGSVGEPRDLPVAGGSAQWYLLTYGPVPGHPRERFTDAQGAAVVGSRIAMVALRSVAPTQGRSVSAAMPTTLRRAAARLR